jgi:Fe-S oxidoreductase
MLLYTLPKKKEYYDIIEEIRRNYVNLYQTSPYYIGGISYLEKDNNLIVLQGLKLFLFNAPKWLLKFGVKAMLSKKKIKHKLRVLPTEDIINLVGEKWDKTI